MRAKGFSIFAPIGLLLTAAAFFVPATLAAEPIRVELKSGRIYLAEIDSRTDGNQLWLRFGSANAVLLRRIAWENVARAERGAIPLTPEDLRRLLPEIATAAPEPEPMPEGKGSVLPAVHETAPPGQHAGKVASLSFDVFLANWNGGVEADGLMLRLMPITAEGYLATALGTLDVDLVVIRSRDFNALPDGRGRSFDRIARWTAPITEADFGPSGALIRLPFQAAHPEFQTRLAPYGLVHARYSVPGYGVYEASQDAVRIRPFAPLRDTRQQSNQERFLDLEWRAR